MENKGLIFIPDISGFTQFVNEMEIEHSRLIIEELLELLINANQIGLEISEIEGDAILFFKFGELPDMNSLFKQVEKMFCDFHQRIAAYDYRRFCQCPACASAIKLTLKVVTHYGEFTSYHVKNFNKLLGKDIIIAHQLLKNDIEQHEYWLITDNILHDHSPDRFAKWMEWNASSKITESGVVPFHYTQLSALKNDLAPEPLPQLAISDKVKMISLSREYDTDIITLFHATGDFTHRNQWREGVTKVEEVDHFMPRVGMRCRSISEKGEEVIYTSSYSFHPERIEFSETDEARKTSTYYLLEKIADKKSRLTLDFYIKRNVVSQALFNLTRKKKLEEELLKSLQNLEGLVKTIRFAGQAS